MDMLIYGLLLKQIYSQRTGRDKACVCVRASICVCVCVWTSQKEAEMESLD